MSEILNKTFGETTTTVTTSRYTAALNAVLEKLPESCSSLVEELVTRTIHEVLESVDAVMYYENFSEKEREIVMTAAADYCPATLLTVFEETTPDADTQSARSLFSHGMATNFSPIELEARPHLRAALIAANNLQSNECTRDFDDPATTPNICPTYGTHNAT